MVNRTIRILFFLFYVFSITSISCQAMRRQKDENQEPNRWRYLKRLSSSLSHSFGSSDTRVPKSKEEESGKEQDKDTNSLVSPQKIPAVIREEKAKEEELTLTFSGAITIEDIANILANNKYIKEKTESWSRWKKGYVAKVLLNISPKDRASAFCITQSFLYEDKDDWEEFGSLLYIISNLSEENRDFFIIRSVPSPPSSPSFGKPPSSNTDDVREVDWLAEDKSDRLLLLNIFSRIPEIHWNDMVSLSKRVDFSEDTWTTAMNRARNLITCFHLSEIPAPLRKPIIQYIMEYLPKQYLCEFLIKCEPHNLTNLNNLSETDLQKLLEHLDRYLPFPKQTNMMDSSPSEGDSQDFMRKLDELTDLFTLFCQTPPEELSSALSYTDPLIGKGKNIWGRGYVIKTFLHAPPQRRQGLLLPVRTVILTEMEGINGKDISYVMKAFLKIPEENIWKFNEFIENNLGFFRKKSNTRRTYTRVIYAAAKMSPQKRSEALESFYKFSPHFKEVSLKECGSRFLYLSRVPEETYEEAVSLLNPIIDGVESYDREDITERASTFVKTDWNHFKQFVNALNEQKLGPFDRFKITEEFFRCDLNHRGDFINRLSEIVKELTTGF